MKLEPCIYLAALMLSMWAVASAGASPPEFMLRAPLASTALDPTVLIALIGGIVSLGMIVGPIVTILINNRFKQKETTAKEAREDLVAKRVEEAAAQALKSANEMIEATKTNTQISSAERAHMDGKLDHIGEFVNSSHTALLAIILDGARAQLASNLGEIEARKKKGAKPSPMELRAVKALEASIASQEKAIAERELITKQEAEAKIKRAQTVSAVTQNITMEKAADKMAGAAGTMERTADKASDAIDKIAKTT